MGNREFQERDEFNDDLQRRFAKRAKVTGESSPFTPLGARMIHINVGDPSQIADLMKFFRGIYDDSKTNQEKSHGEEG